MLDWQVELRADGEACTVHGTHPKATEALEDMESMGRTLLPSP
jgi:hypothetical protein